MGVLPGIGGLIAPGGWPLTPFTLQEAIADVGLTTNCEAILDAGDSASYTSGQQWLDVTGKGKTFDRGTTTSAQSSDPTFNGTPGGKSANEYWTTDGGDLFELSIANTPWIEGWHKDGAAFTIAMWMRIANGASGSFWATGGIGDRGAIGFIENGNGGCPAMYVGSGSGTVYQRGSAPDSLPSSEWCMSYWSVDEANSKVIIGVDGTYHTHNGVAYASPSSSASSQVLRIFDGFNSGTRLGMFSMWSRALAASEIAALFDRTRLRYGV